MGRKPITEDECERMREMHADGAPYTRIADKIGCAPETVGDHCRGRCQHERSLDSSINRAAIEFRLVRLAETLGRVPTMEEWDNAERASPTASHVAGVYGSWSDVLREVGLPVVPSNARQPIREQAYQDAAPVTNTGAGSDGDSSTAEVYHGP